MIDLRTCKPGDKLKARTGEILTYKEYHEGFEFPHEVEYITGEFELAKDDGALYGYNLPNDNDIVEILGQ